MRYLVLFFITVVNLIFVGAVFPNINIAGIAPDVIICSMASITILEKNMTGAAIGLVCGLTLDLLFSGAIGFYAIPYLTTGAILYFVCSKMNYLDNYLIPFFIAVGAYFIKELLFALLVYMMGISYSFSHMLIRYILPETLITGIFMLLIHFIFIRLYRSTSMKLKVSEDYKKFNNM